MCVGRSGPRASGSLKDPVPFVVWRCRGAGESGAMPTNVGSWDHHGIMVEGVRAQLLNLREIFNRVTKPRKCYATGKGSDFQPSPSSSGRRGRLDLRARTENKGDRGRHAERARLKPSSTLASGKQKCPMWEVLVCAPWGLSWEWAEITDEKSVLHACLYMMWRKEG